MPRKRTTIADMIVTYFHDAPLPEARITLQFAAAAVKRREPQLAVSRKPKKRMAKAQLKPAAPAPQGHPPAQPAAAAVAPARRTRRARGVGQAQPPLEGSAPLDDEVG